MDQPKAIRASAHHLVQLVYFMLTKGWPLSKLTRMIMKNASAKEWRKISRVRRVSLAFNLHRRKPLQHECKCPNSQVC